MSEIKLFLASNKDEVLKELQEGGSPVEVSSTIDPSCIVCCDDISQLPKDGLEEARGILVVEPEDIMMGLAQLQGAIDKDFLEDFEFYSKFTFTDFFEAKKNVKSHISTNFLSDFDYLQDLNLIADELISNAFFNAPVDGDGNYLYKSRDRRTGVELEGTKIDFRVLIKRKSTILNCRDRFGSLNPGVVLKYIRHGSGDDLEVSRRTAGAGIGLRLIFNHSDIVTFDLEAGKLTDVYSVACRRAQKYKILLLSR